MKDFWRTEMTPTTAEKVQHPYSAAKAGREPYKVARPSPAEFGRKEIRLAEQEMPGLMALRERYGRRSRSPARASWARCT